MLNVATLSSKGQVTLPKAVRHRLNLRRQDKLIFTVIDDDLFAIKPIKKDILDFAGTVKPKEKPEDFHKIRKFVMKKIARSIAGNH